MWPKGACWQTSSRGQTCATASCFQEERRPSSSSWRSADGSGWDGVFVWEAAYGVDAWTLLGAMAQRTERVRLGTMLTPLPWRRPWKVASQAVTLDQLSGGRAILAVGLGAVETELGNTGEEIDRRVRAEMLDEGIDLIRSFWEGRLRYEGRRYRADLFGRNDLAEVAGPVQERIPIWVVAAWPRPKSMQRVLRCDGLLRMSWTARASGRPRRMTSAPCESGSTSMAPSGLRPRGGRGDPDRRPG